MAYDSKKLKEQALEAIEEHNLFFISDVIACLPCTSPTFYDHFPSNSSEFSDIKKELDKNRISAKIELRKKWLQSDNATMQMGIMKLLSEDEELKKLAMEYKEHGGKIDFNRIEVEIVNPED